ncbi:uroporphyrinogen decarboxylase family protein [Bacteroidota bacterium]
MGEEFARLSRNEKELALRVNVEIILELTDEFGFCAVTAPGGYWEIAPGKPAYYWLPEGYREKQIEMLVKALGKEILLIVNTGGVMAMPDAANFVDFSIKLLTFPEEIDINARKTFEQGKKQLTKYANMGVEAFLSASDLGESQNPYFSPEQMERFIYPYLSKWAEAVKELGGFSILHSDGNINPYMDEIADSGINALQAIDPTAKMDIAELQMLYHERLCLCGNVDIGVLMMESPDEIYHAVKELLSCCGDKGSFIFGCSNAVQEDVPIQNYLALVGAYKDFNSTE